MSDPWEQLKAALDVPFTFDLLRDPEWQPSRQDWKAARDALEAAGKVIEAARTLTSEWCRDCREQPAEFVLWGKLLPPEALGPRCYDCARKHVPDSGLGDPAWAIMNLGPTLRALEKLASEFA